MAVELRAGRWRRTWSGAWIAVCCACSCRSKRQESAPTSTRGLCPACADDTAHEPTAGSVEQRRHRRRRKRLRDREVSDDRDAMCALCAGVERSPDTRQHDCQSGQCVAGMRMPLATSSASTYTLPIVSLTATPIRHCWIGSAAIPFATIRRYAAIIWKTWFGIR